MENSKKTLLLVLVVLSLPYAAGCAHLRDISMFSTQQEVELGQRVSEEVETEVRLLNNPVILNYVREVGAKVASKARRQDVVYVFKIIDDVGQVNAFAVPGGNIYIFSGLLARMESEAELAAVLGHETAHIAERHSMEALTRQVGFSVVISALLGEQAAAWQKILADVTSTMTTLKFSREDEKEADVLGLEYMYSAGYDARGMVNLLELFLELYEREPSVVEEWLSTHPPSSKRIRIVKDLISEHNMHGGRMGVPEYEAKMRAITLKD
ncbi:MAG: M48 family metalloprotease [Planctomycetes bacterium]|nr:M48 family metalloprotease [Planctomycetota bacterium]